MTPLFAEIDWVGVVTAVCGAIVTILGGVGAVTKWVIAKQDALQKERITHENAIADRFEKLQKDHNEHVSDLTRTMMESEKDKTQVLIGINGKMLEAVGALTREIADTRVTMGNQGKLLEQLTTTVAQLADDAQRDRQRYLAATPGPAKAEKKP